MLAKLDLTPLMSPVQLPQDYSGFPWWHALLVEPNRETKAADWLKRVNVFAYLPTFSKVVRRAGSVSTRRLCAALPGMMFIPQEMMDIPRRDEVFKFAHVHGYLRSGDGAPTTIKKSDIELIRLMEAKLNAPPDSYVDSKGVVLEVGQKVMFVDPLFADGWGTAVVVEIASEHRIGIEVAGLFGRATKTYVPAPELEVM